MTAQKKMRDLEGVLTSRTKGPFLSVICEEAPGLLGGLEDTLHHCSVDFDLLAGAVKAARTTLAEPRRARELSAEWNELRLALEHVVYYTARLQLLLSASLADAHLRTMHLPRLFRFAWGGSGKKVGAQTMATAWRRLLRRRVAPDDFVNEHRLLADAAVFVASANLEGTKMLLALVKGSR